MRREVEDVLASVRRLVADGAAGEAEDRAGGPDRLVLTPAHRVAEPAPLLLTTPVAPRVFRSRARTAPEPTPAPAPLDAEALREIVREVLREELAGPLGDRVTRNVRRLVRREVFRVLASQDD